MNQSGLRIDGETLGGVEDEPRRDLAGGGCLPGGMSWPPSCEEGWQMVPSRAVWEDCCQEDFLGRLGGAAGRQAVEGEQGAALEGGSWVPQQSGKGLGQETGLPECGTDLSRVTEGCLASIVTTAAAPRLWKVPLACTAQEPGVD